MSTIPEIRLCFPDESQYVFDIITRCKLDLERQGIYQWTAHYPTLHTIEQDIAQGQLYQISIDNQLAGIINISTIQEEAYKRVNWQYPETSSLVIHRLAVDPLYQRRGLAGKLMDYAENQGATKGFESIRLDAYTGNKLSLTFYEKRGYIKRGEVMFPHRQLPFHCYEKQL